MMLKRIILPGLSLVIILLLPVTVRFHTSERLEESRPSMSLSVAQADFSCAAAKAAMWSTWWAFVGTGGGVGLGTNAQNSFSGYIAGVLPCWNGIVAFTLNPVLYGLGAPYGVAIMQPPLYSYYQVRPGAKTLGNAPTPNICLICVPTHPWCCIFPPVMNVSVPGMGTSM